MANLSVIVLSCNNFSKFPIEAMYSQKLTEIDLSSNKVCVLADLKNIYVCIYRYL